jgi:hypothetical protein
MPFIMSEYEKKEFIVKTLERVCDNMTNKNYDKSDHRSVYYCVFPIHILPENLEIPRTACSYEIATILYGENHLTQHNNYHESVPPLLFLYDYPRALYTAFSYFLMSCTTKQSLLTREYAEYALFVGV